MDALLVAFDTALRTISGGNHAARPCPRPAVEAPSLADDERALAGALMAALLWFAVPQFDWIALGARPVLRAAGILGLVGAAALVYAVVLLACGLRPRQFIRKET
jgi:hypothetical protein